MITRHYKRIVKDILQRGGAKYDAYAVTASDGRPYYTAQEQPNYSADQTAMSMSTDQPGVIIGSGTAAESETSYWLAQQITSGFSGSVLPTHEMVDGTHTLCLYVTIANTGSSSITISEIGYALITPLMRRPSDSQYIGSPYPIEKNVLIDRTVLASPITIAAGNSVRLKYALKTTDELFSGSVVLIPKTISANGVYNASSDNADGYSEVTVSVTPNLQSKTVTQNGTVTPDQGYDGLSSVVVNVSGGGDTRVPIAEWDFTVSLNDILNNLPATLSGGTQSSDGVTLGYVTLPTWLKNPYGKRIELDCGVLNFTERTGTNFNQLLTICNTSYGIAWKGGSWVLITSQGDVSLGSSDKSFFDNSTLRADIDAVGKVSVYKNGVILVSNISVVTSQGLSDPLQISRSGSYSFNGGPIKKCRLY